MINSSEKIKKTISLNMYQSITKLNNHELKEANKNKNINYNKILSNDRKRTLTLGNHLINSH